MVTGYLSYIFLTRENYLLVKNELINRNKPLYYRQKYAPELGTETPYDFFNRAHDKARSIIWNTFQPVDEQEKQVIANRIADAIDPRITKEGNKERTELVNQIIEAYFGTFSDEMGRLGTEKANKKGITINPENPSEGRVSLQEIQNELKKTSEILKNMDSQRVIGKTTAGKLFAQSNDLADKLEALKTELEEEEKATGVNITNEINKFLTPMTKAKNGERIVKGIGKIGERDTNLILDVCSFTWALMGKKAAARASGSMLEMRVALDDFFRGEGNLERVKNLLKAGKSIEEILTETIIADNIWTGPKNYQGMSLITSESGFASRVNNEKDNNRFMRGIASELKQFELSQFEGTDEFGTNYLYNGGVFNISGRQMKTDVKIDIGNNKIENISLKNYFIGDELRYGISLVSKTNLFNTLAYASIIDSAYIGHFLNLFSEHYVYQSKEKKGKRYKGKLVARYLPENYEKQGGAGDMFLGGYAQAKQSFFEILLMQAIAGRDTDANGNWDPANFLVINDKSSSNIFVLSVGELIKQLSDTKNLQDSLQGDAVTFIKNLNKPIFKNKPEKIGNREAKFSALAHRAAKVYKQAREKKLSLALKDSNLKLSTPYSKNL